MKKLSIITINRNNAEGLLKTIESVVSQTFDNYEYIIIDGASTDSSVNTIKQYADKVTYWVSEPVKGIYNAMNKGILQAKGEYCLFLNSGDYLYSNDVLYKAFIENNCDEDIVTGDMLKLYPDQTSRLDKGQAYARKQEGRELTLFDMYWGTLNHSSSFIKRKLFDEYGLYDENYKIVSDWIFFLKTIGLNNAKVKYIDLIISSFDMSGVSNVNMNLRNKERSEVIESNFPSNFLKDYEYFHQLLQQIQSLQQLRQIEKKYNYLFEYSFTYFIARFVNKVIRLFHKN